jgi:hypothetical protein
MVCDSCNRPEVHFTFLMDLQGLIKVSVRTKVRGRGRIRARFVVHHK